MLNCYRYLIVGALGVAVAGCGGRQGPPAGSAGPPEVTVAKPLVLTTLDWDTYTGRLAPIDEVEVRARVSGYLESHHFEEGQFVEQGQLLFVIDERPYQATVAQAKAALEEAYARRRQSESQVREAEAKRQQVAAQVELTQAQLRRARPLVPSGAISEDDYDELVAAARKAEADSFAAEAEIESAHAAVNAAQAAIATAEAAVTSAELDLGYCRIAAPIHGRVSRRLITQGNLVSGGLGSTLLTTIVSTNPIHAYFDANEQALIKYLRMAKSRNRDTSEKTPVYMSLADEKGYPHHGYIDFVDNRVNQSTGSIRARAIFANPNGLLVPGVFVRMRVPSGFAAERALIPDSAVATDQASKYVYVVEDGKVAIRRVTTGSLSKGLREIVDGLTGDELVVTRGLQRCRPGAEVKTTTEVVEPGADDGLPDDYEPVPPEEWLQQPVAPVSPAGRSEGAER